jgi:Flp pilus assembly protein protease CpaA
MDLLLFVFAFFGFLYASYTDLKSKTVPDNLVYGMIVLGIFIRILQAIFIGLEAISFTITTLVIYSIIGYIFYRFRGWADGDFGIFIIIALFLDSTTNAPWAAYLSYISNLALIGIVYGFAYTLYLASKPKVFKHWTKEMTQPMWFVSIILGILASFTTDRVGLTYLPGFIFGFFSLRLIIVSKSLNKFMKRWVTPEELETGDWVLEDVKVGKKIIISKDNPGLTRSQISQLEKLYSKGKVKKILIKDGIPFIPVFFLAYLASTFHGDLIYTLIQSMI